MRDQKGERTLEMRRGDRGTLRLDHPVYKSALAGLVLDADDIAKISPFGNAIARAAALWQSGKPNRLAVGKIDKSRAGQMLRFEMSKLKGGAE